MIRWLLVLSVLWVAASARAQTYERQRTSRLMVRHGFEEEPRPEGKRIAWVRVERDDVFVADEIWPTWPNIFHGRTRESVVRRELLFQPGDPYTEARIDETMRNLRSMGIFALARIVPVRTERADEVGVLVHTRDLWSLRLETSYNGAGKVIDQFIINMVERNAFGRNKTLGVTSVVYPQNYTLAQTYAARRVFGSSVQFQETAGVYVNRYSGRPEGSLWLLSLGQPYFQLSQRYAWKLYVTYQDHVARGLRNGQVRSVASPNVGPELPNPKLAWRERELVSYLKGSYRLGELVKQTFSAGFDARRTYAHANAETQLVPELESYFRSRYLPRTRTELGPLLEYEMFTARYVAFENLASYGMTENVRVGPSASITTRLPLRAFGSNTDSWVLAALLGYTYSARDALIDLQLEGRMRLEAQKWVDQRGVVVLRGASPVLLRTFRVVARSAIEARRRDRANTFVSLGASNGLRGYESQAIAANGASRFLTNIELRSMPIEWQAVHVGLVLFYDVGTVYTELSQARLYHGAGAGLRILFPHLNRTPFAVDGGFGFDRLRMPVPTFSSKQVVPVTAAEDPE